MGAAGVSTCLLETPNTEVFGLPQLVLPLQLWSVQWIGLPVFFSFRKPSKGEPERAKKKQKKKSLCSGTELFWTSGTRSQRESDPMALAGQTYPSGPAEGARLGESLSLHGSAEKLSPSAVNRVLMELLMYFGRAVLVFYPVYLTGYLGLSVSWVLLCMVMATWWRKNRQWKDARIGTAIDFVDNEAHVVNKELQSALQMASWVCIVLMRNTTHAVCH